MKFSLTILATSFLLLLDCNNRDSTRYTLYDSIDSLSRYDGFNKPIDISKWTYNKPKDTLHVKSFSVILYRPNGIMNMNDVLYNDSNYYQACMACSYDEGGLKDFYLYGTEGKYKIEKNELYNYKNVPLNREISIKNSKVYDLMEQKVILKNKEDSLICSYNDSIYLYIIKR